MNVLKVCVVLAVLAYLLLLAVAFTTQRKLLYYPSHVYVPLSEAHANSSFQEISERTADGIDLKAWYAPATSKALTIVFFHGNADFLANAAQVADPYIAAGYGFLVTEYRGYSGLPGTPTETGLYNDGRAYMNALATRGVDSRHIIIYGHSLGTGVASQMALEFNVAGLMLLSPYLSIPALARIHFPFLPAGLIARDRFENEKKIRNIHVPVLIANGAADEVIPPSQGKQLFSLANEPKEFHSLPGRGHNDSFDDFARLSIDWISRICHPGGPCS